MPIEEARMEAIEPYRIESKYIDGLYGDRQLLFFTYLPTQLL